MTLPYYFAVQYRAELTTHWCWMTDQPLGSHCPQRLSA